MVKNTALCKKGVDTWDDGICISATVSIVSSLLAKVQLEAWKSCSAKKA
jgi:hypothetical protein